MLGWHAGAAGATLDGTDRQEAYVTARTPEETHAALEAAFNTGDLDAFLAIHEPGAATISPLTGEAVAGLEAMRSSLEPIFARRPRAEIEVLAKLQSDELALTLARWTLTMTDGEPVELSGRGTIVSRRPPDGTWRIVLDIPRRPD